MKTLIIILLILSFAAGYWQGYQHAYKPLHDELQALQAEDWKHWVKP